MGMPNYNPTHVKNIRLGKAKVIAMFSISVFAFSASIYIFPYSSSDILPLFFKNFTSSTQKIKLHGSVAGDFVDKCQLSQDLTNWFV